MAQQARYKLPRVICSVCGCEYPGSLHGSRGDWTAMMPRKHKVDGKICDGVYEWGEIVPMIVRDGFYIKTTA